MVNGILPEVLQKDLLTFIGSFVQHETRKFPVRCRWSVCDFCRSRTKQNSDDAPRFIDRLRCSDAKETFSRSDSNQPLHSRHSELFSCWVSTSKWILLLSCRRWCFVYAPTTQQNSRKDDAMVTWISHVSPYEVLQLWSWGATRRTATQPLASSSTSSIVELRSY